MASAKSDHLTLLSAYKGWLQAKDQGNVFQYCNEVTYPSLPPSSFLLQRLNTYFLRIIYRMLL